MAQSIRLENPHEMSRLRSGFSRGGGVYLNATGASERFKVEKHGIDSAHSYQEIMHRPRKKKSLELKSMPEQLLPPQVLWQGVCA